MLKYISAVATAVTLTVCTVVAKADQLPTSDVADWAIPFNKVLIDRQVASPATYATGKPIYFLSLHEQAALRRALFRSARFID